MSDQNMPDVAMPPTMTDGVGAAHAHWWDALLAADTAALDTLLADDLTFHSPYGTAETKAAFLGNLRSGRLGYDAIRDADGGEHRQTVLRRNQRRQAHAVQTGVERSGIAAMAGKPLLQPFVVDHPQRLVHCVDHRRRRRVMVDAVSPPVFRQQ